MHINKNIHHGIKIGERDSHNTRTMKPAIYRHVLHPYMIIHTITDKVVHTKIIDLYLLNATRQLT